MGSFKFNRRIQDNSQGWSNFLEVPAAMQCTGKTGKWACCHAIPLHWAVHISKPQSYLMNARKQNCAKAWICHPCPCPCPCSGIYDEHAQCWLQKIPLASPCICARFSDDCASFFPSWDMGLPVGSLPRARRLMSTWNRYRFKRSHPGRFKSSRPQTLPFALPGSWHLPFILLIKWLVWEGGLEAPGANNIIGKHRAIIQFLACPWQIVYYGICV